MFVNIISLFVETLPYLFIFLIILLIIIFFVFVYKKRCSLVESIKLNINKFGCNFNLEERRKNELFYYKKLFTNRVTFLGYFSINGSYKHIGFTYFQIFSKLRWYSVLVFNGKKYDRNFDSICITPQTKINFSKDTDLEWIKFNKNFINKFDNPATALEIVTPHFMELLLNLKNKYDFIEVRYFSDEEYQKESIVVIKRGYIFPVIFFRKKFSEKYFKSFLGYLEDGNNLVDSV